MKVAFVAHYDARNIKYWSGTPYYMAESLKKAGIEVSYVGPLKKRIDILNFSKWAINKFVLRHNDRPQFDPGFLRYYGQQASAMLESVDADLVFGPNEQSLAYLKTRRPMVLWTDATFANLVDYYPAWTRLSARTLRNGHAAERRALRNCDLMIYSSQWAADSAINDYGMDPEKTLVVPFGGNMPGLPSIDALEAVVDARVSSLSRKLTLFCSGVDWYRKGMDVASAVVGRLNAGGVAAELLIAGCSPPRGQPTPENVELLGFISKNSDTGFARLNSLYQSAHWFLCPTRADCTPMVLCEAASYGLPALATNTGGVSSLVADGISGWVCAPDASPDIWADRIVQTIRKPQAYRQMCLAAHHEYVERLNWAAAGAKIRLALEGLLAKEQRPTL